MKRGHSFADVFAVIDTELRTRIQKTTEAAAQLIPKYFENKTKALAALEGFESRIAIADITDTDIMANAIIEELNPLMNTFQQLMIKQAEIAAYEQLLEKISHCQAIPDFAEAFQLPETVNGYFERTVLQCATKLYGKIFNIVVSQFAGRKQSQANKHTHH